MKHEMIEIHGVTLMLSPDGSVEASAGGPSIARSMTVESILLFFLLREMQALNGVLREPRPLQRNAVTQSIFPP